MCIWSDVTMKFPSIESYPLLLCEERDSYRLLRDPISGFQSSVSVTLEAACHGRKSDRAVPTQTLYSKETVRDPGDGRRVRLSLVEHVPCPGK